MSTFASYFFFAPVFAVVFGFLGWMVPALLFRGAVARRRVGVQTLFRTGYAIIAVVSLFLLVIGTRTSQRVQHPDGTVKYVAGPRDHDVAPLLGTAASFVVVWLVQRQWRRWQLRRGGGPGGPAGFGGLGDRWRPRRGGSRGLEYDEG
ncbi:MULTISPECIES: hypothetical protein [Protofrankia]|uniref:Uncharacterized protein n=1 Tax=Candidatus Protofrankia datiscae TaxID=2716812 RepID=F8B054_9ACTN|nr:MULTISPECIES: hypothetical protein [Protofrankia]AEH11754.1 hypothetical protein FsymDg_4506 [Candidatus Protofrankia datiscae]